MNLLTNELPTSVCIKGRTYDINCDYRASVQFELLVQDASLSEEVRLLRALELYYPRMPDDLAEAVEQLLRFYRCGSPLPGAGEDSAGGDSYTAPAYSFAEDAPYFYAAFLSEYGIDLVDVPFLHWWKFKALFDALPEDCRLMQIISYRTVPLSGKMSQEQRGFYSRMKKLYALHSGEKARKAANVDEYRQSMIDYVDKRFREAGEDRPQCGE